MAAGDLTRKMILAQPDWLRGVPERVGERRLPAGRVAFTGCGTSYHAAQVGAELARGEAWQALELVLRGSDADALVAVSHKGTTPLTLEAAQAFDGPVWAVTADPESPLAEVAEEVVVAAPADEESMCHTASYTAAIATMAALAGLQVGHLPDLVEEALGERLEPSDHDRIVIVGAGADWATAQEAALKLREGVFLPAEAYETEQLLHGHLAAIDDTFRVFLLEGDGRAAERTADAARALAELGVEAEVLEQSYDRAVRAILGILPFHLLVVDLAERRGVNPDLIRRDDDRWARARAAYS